MALLNNFKSENKKQKAFALLQGLFLLTYFSYRPAFAVLLGFF